MHYMCYWFWRLVSVVLGIIQRWFYWLYMLTLRRQVRYCERRGWFERIDGCLEVAVNRYFSDWLEREGYVLDGSDSSSGGIGGAVGSGVHSDENRSAS